MFIHEAPDIEEALELAVDAIDRGDISLGSDILEWVLQNEPTNTHALLWMAYTMVDEDSKRMYYSRIDS